MPLQFQLLDQCARNMKDPVTHQKHTSICLFGKTKDGNNVCARVRYKPFIMVEPVQRCELTDRKIQSLITGVHQQSNKKNEWTVADAQYKVVYLKHCYGWIPESMDDGSKTATFPIIKLHLPTNDILTEVSSLLQLTHNVWESRVSTVHKMSDDCNIQSSNWIEIADGGYRDAREEFATADILVEVDRAENVKPMQQEEGKIQMAPFVIASIDIECDSKEGFPIAGRDTIIGIGTSIKRYGKDGFERHYFGLYDIVLPVTCKNHITVHCYQNQKDMLMNWRTWFSSLNPDVITGYNINGFDFDFMAKTVDSFNNSDYSDRWFKLSRFPYQSTPLKSPEFESKAIGQRQFYTFQMTGRLVVDMLEVIRREKKFRSYKLDDVVKEIFQCSGCKNLPSRRGDCEKCGGVGAKMAKIDLPPQELFRRFKGSAEDRGIIAEYCSMDCDLVLQLMESLKTLENIIEMSKVTLTPAQDIVSRGQQQKVFNQIVWYAHREGYVVNDAQDIVVSGYKGATVLDPSPGFHAEPIATLDFQSLYPSIMIQNNLCCSTWIIDPKYYNVPGIKTTVVKNDGREYHFIQHIVGFTPKILKHLLGARKSVKNMMKAAKSNPFLYSLLDGQQLAIKLSCNSVYGFYGTKLMGRYPCLPVSDSTTYFGRQMISALKATVEEKWVGSKVIYGDSVVGFTPIIVKNNVGKIYITTIERLFREIGASGANFVSGNEEREEGSTEIPARGTKQYASGKVYYTWTESRWSRIHSVMRHLKNPEKKLWRIVTPTGIVIVTEDHSLLLDDDTVVKPSDLQNQKNNLQQLLTVQLPTHLHVQVPTSSDYKFVATNTAASYCFNEDEDGQLKAANMYYHLEYNLGLPNVTLDAFGANYYVSYGFFNQIQRFEIEEWCGETSRESGENDDRSNYVYDLTTANHHFHAGIGNLIVHNTDSIMVKFSVQTHPTPIEESFRLGYQVSKLAHEMFGEFINLEMEKVFDGYVLLSKKRYAGLMYEKPNEPPKLKMSGVEAVRRDFAILVTDTQERVINALLLDKNIDKAKSIIIRKLEDLVSDRIPFEEYVLSCQMKREDAYKQENPFQLHLIRKIEARNPGGAPKSGDRVAFVVVITKGLKDPYYKKVEDAKYAREAGVAIDRLYYLQNQLERPLSDLMDAFVPNNKQMFDKYRDMLICTIGQLQARLGGLVDIRQFCKKSEDPGLEAVTRHLLPTATTTPTSTKKRKKESSVTNELNINSSSGGSNKKQLSLKTMFNKKE